MQTLVDSIRPLCRETAEFLKAWKISKHDILVLDMADVDGFSVSLKSTSDWQIPSHTARTWAASVPESAFDKKHGLRWRMAATDVTCLLIMATWPNEQIEATEEARLVLEMQVLRFQNQIRIAKAQAEFKESEILPDGLGNDPILAPYQELAAWCAAESEQGFAFFMEQGTGKTPVQIRHAEMEMARLDSEHPYRALVICPPNARWNWGNELKKFVVRSEELDYAFIDCTGGVLERTKRVIDALACDKPPYDRVIVAVGFDGFKNSFAAFMACRWNLCSVDESHNFKSKNTQLWKKLEDFRENCDKRTVLTGTAVANTLADIWTQLEFVGKGVSGFHSFEAFRKFHAPYFTDGAGYERLLGYTNVPMLQERLTRYSFIIRLREAMPDLPERVFNVSTCEMTDEQREIYLQMRDVLRAEIKSDLEKDMPEAMTANNVLTKLMRLCQITSGFLKIDDQYDFDTGELISKGSLNRIDPNPKMDLLVEHRKSDPKTSKALTWCTWTQDIKGVTARLNEEGFKARALYGSTPMDERIEIMRLFNTTHEVTDIVGQPKTLKESVTLLGQVDEDTNCDRVYIYSKNWSILERLQKLGRNHRRGVRVMTQVTDLHCENSIDEDVYEALQRKETNALALQDVRKILRRVLEL